MLEIKIKEIKDKTILCDLLMKELRGKVLDTKWDECQTYYTVRQADITRLRRELNELSKMIGDINR